MELLNLPFIQLSPGQIPRPYLPTVFLNPHTKKKIKVYALIDTGADECALPAGYASLIGHNLESGKVKQIGTGNGPTNAYSHTMCIHVNDHEINDVLFDFMPNLSTPLLGVKNFLTYFILTIDYPKQQFSLISKK